MLCSMNLTKNLLKKKNYSLCNTHPYKNISMDHHTLYNMKLKKNHFSNNEDIFMCVFVYAYDVCGFVIKSFFSIE